MGQLPAHRPLSERVSAAGPRCQGDGQPNPPASGKVPRASFRTVRSRSIFRISDYDGVLVADLAYRPAAEAAMIEAFNPAFQADFPADVPLNLVTTLLGFANVAVAHLRKLVADDNPANRARIEKIIEVIEAE